jgi:hypothetical protein
MQRLIWGLLAILILLPQEVYAKSSDKNYIQYKAIRVEHSHTIQFIYNNTKYTVYATDCKEIITQPIESTYIILSPGDPVELKDENGNVLILGLPQNM